VASGARRTATSCAAARTLLWPSYSTWMGIYCIYMRMGPEGEREAAREVGLPLSTSPARSSWPKRSKHESRDWTRRNFNREAFLAIELIERRAGRQPLCDRKGPPKLRLLFAPWTSPPPPLTSRRRVLRSICVLEGISRAPRCTPTMRSHRQSAKSSPNVLRLQPIVRLRRHSFNLLLATMGSGET